MRVSTAVLLLSFLYHLLHSYILYFMALLYVLFALLGTKYRVEQLNVWEKYTNLQIVKLQV